MPLTDKQKTIKEDLKKFVSLNYAATPQDFIWLSSRFSYIYSFPPALSA